MQLSPISNPPYLADKSASGPPFTKGFHRRSFPQSRKRLYPLRYNERQFQPSQVESSGFIPALLTSESLHHALTNFRAVKLPSHPDVALQAVGCKRIVVAIEILSTGIPLL